MLQRVEGQADEGEDREGEREDEQVQTPVHQPAQGLAGGQAGTVEEEEDGDDDLHDPVHDVGEGAVGREDECQDHAEDDEHDQEIRPVSQYAGDNVPHGGGNYWNSPMMSRYSSRNSGDMVTEGSRGRGRLTCTSRFTVPGRELMMTTRSAV